MIENAKNGDVSIVAPWWFDTEHMCTRVVRGTHPDGVETLAFVQQPRLQAQLTLWPATSRGACEWHVEYRTRHDDVSYLTLPRNVLLEAFGITQSRHLNNRCIQLALGAEKAFAGELVLRGAFLTIPCARAPNESREWASRAVSIYLHETIKRTVREHLKKYS